MSDYTTFLRQKIKMASFKGFQIEPHACHEILFPHQRDIVRWAVLGGNRAIFASFGLGKSVMQCEWLRLIVAAINEAGLIVCPLGVRQELIRDAAMLGIELRFIRSAAEMVDGHLFYITNYETVRDGKLDPRIFGAVSLDEASVLRSFGSKTYQEFLPLFEGVKFKLVNTATPSPNRFKELIHYAGFLGVMDTGQALTRFFQRDSEKAGNLTLYPHKEQEFWLWVSSWAVFVQRPSDLGYSDEGYDLPPIEVRYHEVPTDYSKAGADRDGQALMFQDPALGLSAAAAEKRDSMPARVETMGKIVDAYIRGSQDLSARLLREEQGRSAEEAAGPQCSALQGQQGEAQSQVDCVANGQSVPHGRVAATVSGAQQGTACSEAQGDLRSEQAGRTGAATCCEVAPLRADESAISGDAASPGGRLPDLHPADEPASGRSRSRNRRGSGSALPQVQCGTGSAAGQSDSPDSGGGVPDQIVIWCDLNAEQDAIERALADRGLTFSSVHGALTTEEAERRIQEWRDRKTYALIGKPVMLGQGMNLQQCNKAIFVGVTYKFNDLIQAVHRIQRYGQKRVCDIHITYSEAEREVLRTLQAKWEQHDRMVENMTEIIKKYGLNQLAMQEVLARSIGVKRIEAVSDLYAVANNDCVEEAKLQPDNSVSLIVTSIPFANHYEYSPSYNDFGHTEDNDHFWSQMDFLTPELLRILQPGRIYACHVKDRILFGNVTGAGAPTVSPFHCEAIMHGRKHGFDYMGLITIVTDVVRENNQTYRLGWSEQCKDGTKMGVGSPEYVVLFRKPQTDRTKGYADVPVSKSKQDYTRAHWQVDAHAFWRSSGDRQITAEQLAGLGPDKLASLFTKYTLQQVYDYEFHIRIGEELEARGALPSTFMSLAPGSHHPDVWHDINRMRTLNGDQANRAVEKHVCLARGSLVLTRERGYVPIETVQVGEHALTHRGRWQPVLAARQTGYRPTITVRAQGVPGLTLTPDHKLWARVTDWSRERDGAERATPQWVPAEATLGGYVNLKLPDTWPSVVDSAQHWWIVGRWIADGHWEARGGASISCGAHEVESLAARLGEHAGAWRTTHTAHQVHILDRSGAIRETLAECGEGAAGKHLPAIAATLPIEQARALLMGYLSGDGHFVESRGRWMATTVSRALALGVAMLAQRVFGSVAAVYEGREDRESTIQGRTVHCRQEWVVSFDVSTDGRKRPFILDDGAWKKVRTLEDSGEQEVWCLRVAEDESFTAEGCIVKNCPLQFDIVDRLIERYSNKGEWVYDPFGGLMTVPYRAILKGRKGRASELNPAYFLDGCHYLKSAEQQVSMPSLFDVLEVVEVAA